MDMRSFLQMSHIDTLGFFLRELRAIPPARELSKEEGAHVAAILAHYALTSCETEKLASSPTTLAHWMNEAAFGEEEVSAKKEVALMVARQSLLKGGFFRDHEAVRREVLWYDAIGRVSYRKLIPHAAGPKQKAVFEAMAVNYHTWSLICRDLHRALRKFGQTQTVDFTVTH